MKTEYFANLVRARKVLNPLWIKSLSRGRCWGSKDIKNPLAYSNIVIFVQGRGAIEGIVVSQGEEGKLRLHEFSETKGTELGSKVRRIFSEAELTIEDT